MNTKQDSWEKLAKDNFAEAERLQILNDALLEALENLLADYETDTPKGNHECHSMKQARAAIAKAKGGSMKREKPYSVGKTDCNGEVWRFDTLEEAEAKIAELEKQDPDFVHAGAYFLDGPGEE